MDEAQGNERRINIHFSPEIMAGSYANFANVSHSDYEFTITFARVDHEVDAHARPQRHAGRHVLEVDAHGHALHDLGVVAARVVRRQQAEARARGG